MTATIDHLPNQERAAKGIAKEDKAREFLVRIGLDIEKGTKEEDCVYKTDWWWNYKGKCLRCAFKSRESVIRNKAWNDILMAVYDPWYGPFNEGTMKGRDVVIEYDRYFVLSGLEDEIWSCSGHRLHEIAVDMLGELEASEFQISRYEPFFSKKHPTCQLRIHRDRFGGHRKILAFIPPAYLSPKEIFRIPYRKAVKRRSTLIT